MNMAKNYINHGIALPFVTANAVISGGFVALGKLVGIADRTTAVTEDNELHRVGQWNVPKIAGALAVGAEYKIDITDKDAIVHTLAAASATVIVVGVVTRAALSADATVDIVLTP